MNAKVHDTIGVSPAELLFGQGINLYSGLLSGIPPESLTKGLDDAAGSRLSNHVAKLVKAQHELIEVARINQVTSDSYHMKEAISFSNVYPVNSYVLLSPPDSSRTKMQMPKAGPYIVAPLAALSARIFMFLATLASARAISSSLAVAPLSKYISAASSRHRDCVLHRD